MLDDLDRIAKKSRLIGVNGRRRIGKTTLLLCWATRSGRRYLYCPMGRERERQVLRDFALLVRRQFAASVDAHPTNWDEALELANTAADGRPWTLIVDDFQNVDDAGQFLASARRAVERFQSATIIVAGTHVGLDVELTVAPLSLGGMRKFLPKYNLVEILRTRAVVGGVPGYMERLNSDRNLDENLREQIFSPSGAFHDEPTVLLSMLGAREAINYEGILRAVASDASSPKLISEKTGLPATSLPPYLGRLTDWGLLERKLDALVPMEKRETSTRSRYGFADPYLGFHYRFVAPNLDDIERRAGDKLWERIKGEFEDFVGTTFADLCRDWAARPNTLPFVPEVVGEHSSKTVKFDVMAVNWTERSILFGRCVWSKEKVDSDAFLQLANDARAETPTGFCAHLAFFAKQFTNAARKTGEKNRTITVALEDLDD